MDNHESAHDLLADMGSAPELARQLTLVAAENEHYPEPVQINEEPNGPGGYNLELTTGEEQRPGMLRASVGMVNEEPKAMIEGIWAGTRRRGEATRLMQGLVQTLKQRGVRELWSFSVSADAVKFRAKFFGEAALRFYDSDHPENGFLPLTVDDAIATAERLDELAGQDKLNRKSNFGVVVDLDQVNSSDWTEPTPSPYPMTDIVPSSPGIPTNLALGREESTSELKKAA